jgi:hypothetical protein
LTPFWSWKARSPLSWPRTAAQRPSLCFSSFSCVVYFLLTLLWMIPTLRSGFGKDTCGVVRLIVHYGLISISTASIVYFMALSRNILSRLANISTTTYGSHTANRLGLPLSPPNPIHAQLTFRPLDEPETDSTPPPQSLKVCPFPISQFRGTMAFPPIVF